KSGNDDPYTLIMGGAMQKLTDNNENLNGEATAVGGDGASAFDGAAVTPRPATEPEPERPADVGYETEDYRDAVAMARLFRARPGDVAEVRVLGTPLGTRGTAAGWFDDPEKMARRALQFSGHSKGVYVTLNPVKPELLGRATNRIKQGQKPTTEDGDVVCR